MKLRTVFFAALALIVVAFILAVLAAASVQARQCGMASFYCCEFHGRTTASGERYDQWAMTAAHRTLSFGEMVRVTRTDNNVSVVVRVNDRGPYIQGRVIDLSLGAATALGMVQRGLVRVCIEEHP